MEKSNKRGKIPQSDWPLIMSRYEAGETLASIARTYDCSPPAISYIVSRNREQPANPPAPPAAEAQLIKAPAHAAPSEGVSVTPAAATTPSPETSQEPMPATRPTGMASGESRGRLHLSLGNGSAARNSSAAVNGANGNGHASAAATGRAVQPPGFASPRPTVSNGTGENAPPPAFDAPATAANPFEAARNGYELRLPERSAQQPRDADAARKDASFIDRELRDRVDGDIAAFLAAFDAALAEDTQASRFGLREATDRLLRAGARTRIELERLEARVPLAPRDGAAAPEQAGWRYR